MIDSKALHATSAIMTLNPFIIYRDAPHIVHYEMWALTGTIEWLQPRSREESSMASDLEKEMQIE